MAYSILSQSDAQYNPFDHFFTQNVGHLRSLFVSLFFVSPKDCLVDSFRKQRTKLDIQYYLKNDSILFKLEVFQLEYKLEENLVFSSNKKLFRILTKNE